MNFQINLYVARTSKIARMLHSYPDVMLLIKQLVGSSSLINNHLLTL